MPGNYRGISLLSIPGKVYAMILLHRVAQQAQHKLHEAQCGFRPQRGTTDAIYTLRRLVSSCMEFNTPLAMAFIDLAKAYDTINRAALWRVLRVFGVAPKLVALLQDLHTGTFAAVRLDGQLGPAFEVTSGVRQGCVIAPLLFNLYMDFVVQQALARLPEGCGVQVEFTGRAGAAAPGAGTSLRTIIHLLYADDMALLARTPEHLAAMLHILDATTQAYGMCINATKTEIMLYVGKQGAQLPAAAMPAVVLSGGPVKQVQDFKYLGSWLDALGSMDKEVAVRRAHALAAFHKFDSVWGNKHLKLPHKMLVYNTFVLPTLLYACETWNITQTHLHSLETAHSACLRHLMGARRSHHVRLEHIRFVCGSPPLQLLITQRMLQWRGHIERMSDDRLPFVATYCTPAGGKRPRGKPRQSFERTLCTLMEGVGLDAATGWDEAQDRVKWRAKVKGLQVAPPAPRSQPTRIQPRRSCRGLPPA